VPLFDRYLIVDWSAANQPKTGKDSIWLCEFVPADGMDLKKNLYNPPTRHEAMQIVEAVFNRSIKESERLFAGFDFGFGLPRGAAEVIGGEPTWQSLWSSLERLIEDDEQNKSNRFRVAGELNARFAHIDGPFWGRPAQQQVDLLDRKKPLSAYGDALPERRYCEQSIPRAKSNWQLLGAGSVGSQTLIGIAYLEKLRQKSQFMQALKVWPYETSFADDLPDEPGITIAEVYPSAFTISDYYTDKTTTLDAAQVSTLAHGFAMLDQHGEFRTLLDKPDSLVGEELSCVLQQEGWIVGVSNGHDLLANAIAGEVSAHAV